MDMVLYAFFQRGKLRQDHIGQCDRFALGGSGLANIIVDSDPGAQQFILIQNEAIVMIHPVKLGDVVRAAGIVSYLPVAAIQLPIGIIGFENVDGKAIQSAVDVLCLGQKRIQQGPISIHLIDRLVLSVAGNRYLADFGNFDCI